MSLPLGLVVAAILAGLDPAAARAAQIPPTLADAANRGRAVRVIAKLEDPAGRPGAAARARAEGITVGQWREREIARAQSALVSDLAATGTVPLHMFRSVPFVALEVGSAGLAALERSKKVVAVGPDRAYRPLLNESVPLVGAPDAWGAGADGAGWSIAILDSGVDGSHPLLRDKVVAEACFTRDDCPNGRTGAGSAAPCGAGRCAHGTHVAGIAAGVAPAPNECADAGVARGSSLIAVQVFSRASGEECRESGEDPCLAAYEADVAAALEHLQSLTGTFRIASVNMSLGGDRFASQEDCVSTVAGQLMEAVIQPLRQAGIAVVAASGNGGFADALSSPACLPSVFSVGATDIQDRVAGFSNSASFLSLLAPGTGETFRGMTIGICSAAPGDGAAGFAGTSAAAPHVAGAFAILRQAKPTATPDEMLDALRATGLQIEDPKSGVVTPRIRIFEALQRLTGDMRSSGIQITPDARYRLISKPIQDQRWAIVRNSDDLTVTGNVYSSDGGDPIFLWCMQISDDDNADLDQVIRYSCAVSGPCKSKMCPAPDDWTMIGDDVQIPASFFQAPSGAEAASGRSDRSSVARAEPSEAVAGTTPRDSGLQVTPDGKRVLVSKVVGDQRWAITRNDSDQAVTGNVYLPGGGEPQFVSCQRVGDDGNLDPHEVRIRYSCIASAPCEGPICPGVADWVTIPEHVSLAGAFFLPDRAP